MKYRMKRISNYDDAAIIGLSRVWGSRFRILAFAILCAGMGHFVGTSKNPIYEAEASLVFRFGKEYFPVNAAIHTWQGEPIRVFVDEAIHTEMEILGSRRVLHATLLSLPEESQSVGEADFFEAIQKSIGIKKIEGSYVVKVSYRSESPQASEIFLTAFISSYFASRDAILANSPNEVLRDAEERAKKEVIHAREKLSSYINLNGLSSVDEQIAELITLRVALSSNANSNSDAEDAASQKLLQERNLQDLNRQIKLLEDGKSRLAQLELVLEIAEDSLRTTSKLASDNRLASEINAARGPVIEVLDVAISNSTPVGLSLTGQTILAGIIGLFSLTSLIFLFTWLRIKLAPAEIVD